MPRSRLLVATLGAYVPAAALPAIAGRSDAPGGPLDPAALVVPFCLGFAAAFPVWGRWTDRLDAGLVVRTAMVAMAVAGLLVALAPGEATLVAARVLQGIAAAGIPPAVQAALAQSADEQRTGRALSGMMLAVAAATLAGPAVAPLLGELLGWTGAAVILSSVLPLAVAAARPAPVAPPRPLANDPALTRSERARSERLPPYADDRGVHAGWVVSALVLAGHWTVLTRLSDALGPEGLAVGDGAAGLAALTGAVGLPLVVVAARAGDTTGPRRTMTATLAAGAAGFLLAATADAAALFVASAGVGLAVYWAYLPVVALQVQRSAGALARGRAAGGLYTSMWAAAGAAGLLASFAPSWREVLLGAGLSWALAAVVAARTFLGPAQSSAAWATGVIESAQRPSQR